MSFLDTIKRGAGGTVRAITSGVKQAVGDKPKMQSAIDQPDSNSLPKKLPEWDLPELDPKDPDYKSKLSDHNAIRALEKHFNDNIPGVDFSDYQNKIAKWQKEAPEKRSMNPFVKLGIALGTQDPNNIYAENKTLKGISEREASEHASEMSEFEKTLDFKKEAMTGQIKQLLSQGEFRKALALASTKSQNDITQDRLKSDRAHTDKMAEIDRQNQGKKDVADIRAKATERRITRMVSEADGYGLKAPAINQMRTELVNRAQQLHDARNDDGSPRYSEREINDDLDGTWDQAWAAQEIMQQADLDKSGSIGDPHKQGRPGTPGSVVPAPGAAPAATADGNVRVTNESGKTGSIPAAKVEAWLKANPKRSRL